MSENKKLDLGEFIREQAESEKPYFLYFPMPSPHTPIVPNEEWKGKSWPDGTLDSKGSRDESLA